MPRSPIVRSFSIDRCICEQKLFANLLAIAEEHDLSLEDLARREGCGVNCGLCVAYLRRAYETGETKFSELLATQHLDMEDDERLALRDERRQARRGRRGA